MSDYKPITGELRKYATVAWDPWPDARDRLYQMCDRIDAIHEGLERENAELRAARGDDWIKLPVDADGLPIRIRDVMEERSGHTFEVASLMVFGGSDNWLVLSNPRNFSSFREPHDIRHHRPDTWERIIEDALDGYHDTDFEKLVARCKKLAGDAS